MVYLASDNTSPVHPNILKALTTSTDHQKSYGYDDASAAAQALFARIFETDRLTFYPVFTGSAANSLALAALCRGSEGFVCHELSHVNQDECGMPELFSGAKAITIVNGRDKFTADELEQRIVYAINRGIHHVRPRAISITQCTELGTVYSLEEIHAITRIAKHYQLYVHMDGARFTNALVHLGCSAAAMTHLAGVDILSFGGTKNGGMFTEAVVVFEPTLQQSLPYLHKHVGQLASKQRYLSLQWHAFFAEDLWLHNARHANAMARLLAETLATLEHIDIIYPVQANEIFVRMSRERADYLHGCGHIFYDWGIVGADVYRFVTNYCTTAEEIQLFLKDVYNLSFG
ncbi:MAG: low specificity L-threonine aldolase [Alphaproteobacteria bacterium]|nr:MAG: low specificity L-threonine aldolase [Alphaproteobacteria bacterium]